MNYQITFYEVLGALASAASIIGYWQRGGLPNMYREKRAARKARGR